jgi:hypothetical protein
MDKSSASRVHEHLAVIDPQALHDAVIGGFRLEPLHSLIAQRKQPQIPLGIVRLDDQPPPRTSSDSIFSYRRSGSILMCAMTAIITMVSKGPSPA